MVKKMSNIFINVKNDLFGCFRIEDDTRWCQWSRFDRGRKDRNWNDNESKFEGGRRNRKLNYSASIRDARFLRFWIFDLPLLLRFLFGLWWSIHSGKFSWTAKKANNTLTLPISGNLVMRVKYKLKPSCLDCKNSRFVLPNNPVMWRLLGNDIRNLPYL